MRPQLRTATVLLAILAMLAPSALDAALAVHAALEAHHDLDTHHHDRGDASPVPGAVHGHAHPDGTPAHDHGTSLPEASTRLAGAAALSEASGWLADHPPDAVAWTSTAAARPAPSPPTVSTAILRI